MRDSFVFYRSYLDVVNEIIKIDGVEAGNKFLRCIMDYAFEGVEPTFTNTYYAMTWKIMKPLIDNSCRRYDACVVNGKKGGRPKKEAENNNPKKPKNNLTETKEKTYSKPKEKPNENPNDNENDNVNDNYHSNYQKDNSHSFADAPHSAPLRGAEGSPAQETRGTADKNPRRKLTYEEEIAKVIVGYEDEERVKEGIRQKKTPFYMEAIVNSIRLDREAKAEERAEAETEEELPNTAETENGDKEEKVWEQKL